MNKNLSWTLHTLKCISFALLGKKSAYNTLHLCFSPLYIPAQCHRSGKKGASLEFSGLFFHAKRNNRVFGSVPSLLKHCSLFSHPLSLVVTWRTLAVLGFYLILVSGGRTHPFFMVYMHTTTNSKELVPVPKRRFEVCFCTVLCGLFLIILWNISNTTVIHNSLCIFSLLCVLYW